MTASPYALLAAAALPSGALFLTGVVKELEDRDVAHTILWERRAGMWQRYKWANRSYDLMAYHTAHSGDTVVLLGFEGTLKVRSEHLGSRLEHLAPPDEADAPSSLRSVSMVQQIGSTLWVCGMRRMIYCRDLDTTEWQRNDADMRLLQRDPVITGLHAVCGRSHAGTSEVLSVGWNGEVWLYALAQGWRALPTPTDCHLRDVCAVPQIGYVAVGDSGTWLYGEPDNMQLGEQHTTAWQQVLMFGDHCLALDDEGRVFSLTSGMQWVPFDPPASSPAHGQRVNHLFALPDRCFYVYDEQVWSRSLDQQWTDETPDALKTWE